MALSGYLVCLLCLCLGLTMANKYTSFREREKQILDHILAPGRYDPRIRPSGSNATHDRPSFTSALIDQGMPPTPGSDIPINVGNTGSLIPPRESPVVVSTSIYVRAIENLDSTSAELNLQLTVRQSWMDERLRYEFMRNEISSVTFQDSSRIWLPDLFFSNEKDGKVHNIMQPNTFVRILPDGQVLYSLRISLKLFCYLDLSSFPFDHQICYILMGSYGHTTRDLVLVWPKWEAITFNHDLLVPDFSLQNSYTNYCNAQTATGDYSCIRVNFLFKRNTGYYITHIYLPTILLVILSWIPFWLHPSASVIRVGINALTFFATCRIVSNHRNIIATVSYAVGLDVWEGMVLIFQLAAVVEYAIVIYLGFDKFSRHNSFHDGTKFVENSNAEIDEAALPAGDNWFQKRRSSYQKLDIVSRIVFPILFLIFNVIYWPTYVSIGNYPTF